MDGGVAISYAALPQVPNNWAIEGLSDFNGDGKADILWRDSASGQWSIWTMNGVTPSFFGGSNVPTDWAMNPKRARSVSLAWDRPANANGIASFKVERSMPGGRWVEVGTTAADASAFLDSGLPPFGTYSYRVRASGNNGTYSAYSNTATSTAGQ
jgi:hypothetical protein